jgi:hypothetical protein
MKVDTRISEARGKGFSEIAFCRKKLNQFMHHEETTGNLALGLRAFAIGEWRLADAFMEESAE